MNKISALKILFAATLFASFGANSAQIKVEEFGEIRVIETSQLYFYELLSYWNSAGEDVKAQIEKAIDGNDYRLPTEHFVMPFIHVDPNDLSGGFTEYLRLREGVIGGGNHPGFRAWHTAWFLSARELGPRYRARFLAFEAFHNALREAFAARRDPARLILVDQYNDLGNRLAMAEDNENLEFTDLGEMIQEVPSLNPQADQEARRAEVAKISQWASRHTGLLGVRGHTLGRQQFLDLAEAFDMLAGQAEELLRADRITAGAIQRLITQGVQLRDQNTALQARYPEQPAEEEDSSDSSSDEEDAPRKKREREEEPNADERPRLVLRLKLTPEILAKIKGQGPSSGGAGM